METVLPTIDVENEDQIEYASHVHPLTLCELDEDCSICHKRCLGGRTYGCNQCGLFLHESCTKIQIPQVIDHFFHPHPLKLAMNTGDVPLDFYCLACSKTLLGLMFACWKCRVYMDVECALLPNKLKQDGCTIDHIQHFKHPHPLILCDDEKKYEKELCRGCGGGLSTRPRFLYDTLMLSEGSDSIYACLRCNLFLHECCARLPPEIDSPFHYHSLELIWYTNAGEFNKCQACDRSSVKCCTYECPGSCKFILGIECAFLTPPILNFESHNHPLTLFPRGNSLLHCQICNEACDSSNIFRCIDCDYNLHLHCGPLPCSIKHKCHIDPLKLMYAFVEDGYEDDTVYCDACEQPRDPDQCVYYCKDCNFIAELKCVEAEVLRSLNDEQGNVKLKTANKTRIRVSAKLISNVITDSVETDSDTEIEHIGAKYLEVKIHENFFSGCYTNEESEQLIEIFNKACVQLHPSDSTVKESNIASCVHIERYELTELQSKGKQEFETSLFSYSSDEESDNGEDAVAEPYSDAFKQVMRDLDSYYSDNELLEIFFQRYYNIVRIGEHKIAQDFASVLKDLLHKYGDFTVESKLSERLKVIFLTMFCDVICSMCLTNVREVDFEVLQKWWKTLKLAQHAGFEIKFALDQLYKVVEAYFGMKAITTFRKTKNKMKSQVEEISNGIEEQKAKLEEKKRHLEKLKSHVDECKYGIEYQSSPVLKECVNHAFEFKWKKAWDGSPIMFH